MPKKFFLILVVTAIILFPLLITGNASGQERSRIQLSSGAVAGMYNGTGFQINSTATNIFADIPLGFRVGIGLTLVQPGSAADARRIFINNATNGIPEKRGHIWDTRIDMLQPINVFSLPRAFIFGGPRYARFTGDFKYVGGNEEFDVRSRQWGLGGGLESHFAMGKRLDFVVTSGYDYFFPAILSGHDTSYSPDDDNVNPREDNTYADADKAINQPEHQLRLMFGINYRY